MNQLARILNLNPCKTRTRHPCSDKSMPSTPTFYILYTSSGKTIHIVILVNFAADCRLLNGDTIGDGHIPTCDLFVQNVKMSSI